MLSPKKGFFHVAPDTVVTKSSRFSGGFGHHHWDPELLVCHFVFWLVALDACLDWIRSAPRSRDFTRVLAAASYFFHQTVATITRKQTPWPLS